MCDKVNEDGSRNRKDNQVGVSTIYKETLIGLLVCGTEATTFKYLYLVISLK